MLPYKRIRVTVMGGEYVLGVSSGLLYSIIKNTAAARKRSPRDAIYAYCLDYERPQSCLRNGDGNGSSQKYYNGFMAAGELMHRGLLTLPGIYPAPMTCAKIRLDTIEGIDWEVVRRYVHKDDDGFYVVLCGKADALIELPEGIGVVELKTTMHKPGRKDVRKWIRRTLVYVYLYSARKGYLIIIDRGDTRNETDIEVPAEAARHVPEIVKRWLRGGSGEEGGGR